MSLIFAPGIYLTLIFRFLDTFFSISPDIVEFPKISGVPYHSSLFCCTELVSALLIFFVRVDSISFLVLTCSSECFTVCSISFTGQFLVFQPRETLAWKIFQLKSQNLHHMVYLKNLEKLLTGVSSSEIIGEEFLLSLNSVSVGWCGADWKFIFLSCSR